MERYAYIFPLYIYTNIAALARSYLNGDHWLARSAPFARGVSGKGPSTARESLRINKEISLGIQCKTVRCRRGSCACAYICTNKEREKVTMKKEGRRALFLLSYYTFRDLRNALVYMYIHTRALAGKRGNLSLSL